LVRIAHATSRVSAPVAVYNCYSLSFVVAANELFREERLAIPDPSEPPVFERVVGVMSARQPEARALAFL